MKTKAKHHPEPWTVTDKGHIVASDSELVADCYAATPRDKANAARIVACVNGCKGINPAAVADMLAALEELRKQLQAHVRLDVKKHFSLMVADVAADKAIIKAKGAA